MTRQLAAFVAELKFDDIPRATIDMSKRLLLDGVGCMLAGVNGAPARNVAAMVRCLGGERQATIFPGNTQGSVRDAAFVNGISLYSVGLNDVHSPSGAHPGACVIPTVLAVGEWRRVPGKELLAAMVAGYEVNGRVGRAIIPTHRERGFHPTGTCGTFGAASAASRLLGFDAEETANALGIAGSQAAGLYECHHDGTSTMIFHAGRAAQNGVEAALLVRWGMTGPATVLEGSKGFFRATSNAYDVDAAMSDPGRRYELRSRHAAAWRSDGVSVQGPTQGNRGNRSAARKLAEPSDLGRRRRQIQAAREPDDWSQRSIRRHRRGGEH